MEYESKNASMPKFLILRPVYYKDKVSVEDQTLFWFVIRMLLYLAKHSRPNIPNVILELSKVNGRVNEPAFLEMHHVIKSVIDIRNMRLKMEPTGDGNEQLDIICFSDSDYTVDPVTR